MTKEIYIFSGLGADERVFQNLDFSGFQITHIKWIDPHGPETIESYASRIILQIKTVKPILIGLSFGGMMALEVAKQIDTEKVILIASAKSKTEIPLYYRIAGQVRLHKFLPAKLLKSTNLLTYWLFGANSEAEKKLLKQILADTDSNFLKWAINSIAGWKNQTSIKNVFHIHGTNDKIIPVIFVKCDAKVQDGGHLMTLNKADEINRLLRQELKNFR